MTTQAPAARDQIASYLAKQSLIPNSEWLASVLFTLPPSPLPVLQKTTEFRLYASDFTHSLQTTAASRFPTDISNGQIQERKLQGPIPIQVLHVEDIGRSKWSQIEAIESAQRGETRRGHEVVRVVQGEEGLSDDSTTSVGPHKLLLQDAAGCRAWAFELVPVANVKTSMSIGAKMLLKNVTVNRGVLVLEPAVCTWLGGKIDSLDKTWKDGLKDRLLAAIQSEPNSGSGDGS